MSKQERWMRGYREPAGDPGWFGPDSVAWRVHAEFGTMLVGGFSALLLQTLHPLVMQGVADHSNYREDPLGRFRRTAGFLGATTYGSDALAREAVRRVRSIHRRVRGVTPDGRSYSASDPALITYVHVTEVWSFLRAYQRYALRPLPADDENRYLEEAAVVARRLGAISVPTSMTEVREYLREVRPELHRTPASDEAVRFLRASVARAPWDVVAHRTVFEAAIDLLPPFARHELRLWRPGCWRLAVVRPTATTLSFLFHWSRPEPPVLGAARERATAQGTKPSGTVPLKVVHQQRPEKRGRRGPERLPVTERR